MLVPTDRESEYGLFLGLFIFWKGFETVLGVADVMYQLISRKDMILTPSQPVNRTNKLLAMIRMSIVIRKNRS